jgi:cyclopropane-fatty-acyl-phospholipid synthase
MSSLALELAERGHVPLPLLRSGVRHLIARRRRQLAAHSATPEASEAALAAFIERMRREPVAAVPELANAQHYELPAAFFQLALGPRLKYSGAYWPAGTGTLAEAELAALELVCERAQLCDGQRILELGCGWGSLALHVARRFPNTRIVAVSNSAVQRRYLEARRPPNLALVTADMNVWQASGDFDRVLSVEMFEHMRNWPALLARIARWLRPDGRLFAHVFSHARVPYAFEDEGTGGGADDWMARHFFSGGIMPCYDLLPRVAAPHLALEQRWWQDGTHYQRTAAAWRALLEHGRGEVLAVLRAHHGESQAARAYQRWRLFFLACEELFGCARGSEWGVAHYRLAPGAPDSRP